MFRRVVITGVGVVSPLGNNKDTFWENLLSGKNGISRITSFDIAGYDRYFAGEIKDFNPGEFMSKRRYSQIGRASQMAIAATKMSLADANIKISDLSSTRLSVCLGTTTGEIGILEEFNNNTIKRNKTLLNSSALISVFPANSLSSNVAMELRARSFNRIFTTACASGNYALGHAFDLIRTSKTDYAVVGGADSLSRIVFTGFGRLYAIAPEKCQPFSKNRKGMIPGEGAGILFLESLENAIKRKAKIYAELLGYGLSCDGCHMTNPSPEGIVKSIKRALINSRIREKDVDYISAHGTGTLENDKAESQAINYVFGEDTKNVPASSIKSMLGHTMGAASALEAIVCCLVLRTKKIPPTANFEGKDSDCDIDCVPNKMREKNAEVVLNNSQAFGGNNACVVLKGIKDAYG